PPIMPITLKREPIQSPEFTLAHSSGGSDCIESAQSADSKGLPRGVDVAASLLGLLITSPLLLASAVLVGLTSSGGILFRQKRVGQHGRTFELYKLRTMKVSS